MISLGGKTQFKTKDKQEDIGICSAQEMRDSDSKLLEK
jgi:hypothetical protein